MESEISKKINIERKTKKNTFSLVSDLDAEESMSKVSYHQFLSFLNFMNLFWLKRNSNEIFIKIYKETSLFAHSIKGLKVNLLNIHHTPDISSSWYVMLERHLVWCIKSWTRSFTYLSSLVGYFQITPDIPYKAENWRALSHVQCYLIYRCLDICRNTFNLQKEHFLAKVSTIFQLLKGLFSNHVRMEKLIPMSQVKTCKARHLH